MYAVIFRATINQLDEEYYKSVERMRNLAMQQYGCIEFVSETGGGEEISISYWHNLEQIKQWEQNPEHFRVQKPGKDRWYRSCQAQVVEVLRQYSKNR